MTISKKLLLLATLGLGLGSSINTIAAEVYSYEETKKQNVFNFALNLKQQNNSQAQIAADWLETKLLNNGYYAYSFGDKITLVLSANLTLEEKIGYILQLKSDQEKEIAEDIAKQTAQQIAYDTRRRNEIITNGLTIIAATITIPALLIISERLGQKIAFALLGA